MAQVKALIGNIKGKDGEKGKDGSENQIFSTSETIIGTWIDGKPIYRKAVTLSTTKVIDMSGISISHGISNIDIPIDCKGVNNTVGAVSNVFWVNTKNSTSGTFYNAEGLEGVKILIFEYTKTTDTATT